MGADLEVWVWRVLLAESRELSDDLLERGVAPSVDEVVTRVLASRRFAADIARYRGPLGEEVAAYLASTGD